MGPTVDENMIMIHDPHHFIFFIWQIKEGLIDLSVVAHCLLQFHVNEMVGHTPMGHKTGLTY